MMQYRPLVEGGSWLQHEYYRWYPGDVGKDGVVYKYKIETSEDNTNWTVKVDKTANNKRIRFKPITLPVPPGMSGLP